MAKFLYAVICLSFSASFRWKNNEVRGMRERERERERDEKYWSKRSYTFP
jgi:hypothetical protein